VLHPLLNASPHPPPPTPSAATTATTATAATTATTAAAATAAAAAAVATNVAAGASSLQGPSQAAGSKTFRALPSAERASAAHAAAWGPMRIPGAAAGAPPPRTAGALPALPSGPAEAADFLQGMGALVARPPERSADEEGGGGGSGRGAWDALAGAAEVQQQVEEALLLPLTHPAAYAAVLAGTRRAAPGAQAEERPTALLFYGPPGTGKTTAAKIAAAQARLAPHTRSARAYLHPSPLTLSACHAATLSPLTPQPAHCRRGCPSSTRRWSRSSRAGSANPSSSSPCSSPAATPSVLG